MADFQGGRNPLPDVPGGTLAGDVIGAALKKLGIFGGGSTTSSASSSAVTVNPAITVITGGGSANPSTGGVATASPIAEATYNPRPLFQAYPSARPASQYDLETGRFDYPKSAPAGDGGLFGLFKGVPDWLLIGGGAVLAMALAGGFFAKGS